MTAALALAEQGFDAYLVEKENELGGHLQARPLHAQRRKPAGTSFSSTKARVSKNQRIHVFTGAAIEGIDGTIGDFRTKISGQWKMF